MLHELPFLEVGKPEMPATLNKDEASMRPLILVEFKQGFVICIALVSSSPEFLPLRRFSMHCKFSYREQRLERRNSLVLL